MADVGAALWSVFFVVATGRFRGSQTLSADQIEDVLEWLHDASGVVALKATEAPHYRRVLLGHERDVGLPAPGPLYWQLRSRPFASVLANTSPVVRRRAPLTVDDGRGVVFGSHLGEVQPSGFLPLVAGNVREAPLTRIYTESELLLPSATRTAMGCPCPVAGPPLPAEPRRLRLPERRARCGQPGGVGRDTCNRRRAGPLVAR